VNEIEDVPELLRAEIEHFFEVYKMLEPGKYAETRGYDGVDAAWTEIEAARDRLNG
jgi:inorganic pyrophosphatase